MQLHFLMVIAFSQFSMAGDNNEHVHNRALDVLRQTYPNLEMNALTIDSMSKVEWPDSSLGCAVPGQVYFQVITPGYFVVIRGQNRQFLLHLSETNGFLCESGRPVRLNQITKAKEATDRKSVIMNTAKGELAARLGANIDDIVLHSILEKSWLDSSLGCGKMQRTYIKKKLNGYVITFGYQGTLHTYHADSHRVIYCTQ